MREDLRALLEHPYRWGPPEDNTIWPATRLFPPVVAEGLGRALDRTTFCTPPALRGTERERHGEDQPMGDVAAELGKLFGTQKKRRYAGYEYVPDLTDPQRVAEAAANAALNVLHQAKDSLAKHERAQLGEVILIAPGGQGNEKRHTVLVLADVVDGPNPEPSPTAKNLPKVLATPVPSNKVMVGDREVPIPTSHSGGGRVYLVNEHGTVTQIPEAYGPAPVALVSMPPNTATVQQANIWNVGPQR